MAPSQAEQKPDPTTRAPNKETDDPIRARLADERAEPNVTESKTLREPEKEADPFTDRKEPRFAAFLTERDDPIQALPLVESERPPI